MHAPAKIFLFLIFLLFFLSCGNDQDYFINQKELANLLKKHVNLIILDVRQPQERTGQLGKIPDSVNIPLQEIEPGLAKLDLPAETPIVLLCRTQNRSQAAYRKLSQMGFTNLYVLQGGMMDYEHNPDY